MRALYCAAADVQRRRDYFVYTQSLGANGRANDIDHRIHSPDFVEMNFVDGSIVNLGFGATQRLKNTDSCFLRAFRDCSRRNDVTDLVQAASMLVNVLMGVRMFVRVRMFVGFAM